MALALRQTRIEVSEGLARSALLQQHPAHAEVGVGGTRVVLQRSLEERSRAFEIVRVERGPREQRVELGAIVHALFAARGMERREKRQE